MNHFIVHIPKTGGTSLEEELKKTNRFIKVKEILTSNEINDLIIKSNIEDPILMSHYFFSLDNNLLNPKYHTIIRNPIDQAISWWSYHVNYSYLNLHNEALHSTCSEFHAKYMNNIICRTILGNNKNYYKPLCNNDVNEVRKILLTYETLEEFDNYNLYIKKLSNKFKIKLNTGQNKFTLGKYLSISKQEYKELKEILEFDCKLYKLLFNKEPEHFYFID